MGILKKLAPINRIIYFLLDIYTSRNLLFQLIKRDFQSRYLASYLGMFWVFAQPFATIFVMFVAFEFGFKPNKIDGDIPFFFWFVLGMIPWFFLSEAILNGANAIQVQGYIIKKVVFRVSLLPLVTISTSFIIHLFFIIVLIIFSLSYGYWPTLYILQIFYYLAASLFLLLGLGWLTSSINIFFKDLGQIINIIVQMGFWITPIFWQVKLIPSKYQFIIKLNPIYYIIKGYRDSFINQVWFWENWKLTLYFWLLSSIIFILGITVFKKLKPHFADVL